jgi:hypothetical protein
VLITMLGSSTAVAAASGAPLPRPVRAVAHNIGLPVDSPALVDARITEDRLRKDLTGSDRQKLAGEVATLKSRLAHVEGDERGQVQNEADSLLHQAGQVLEGGPGQTGDAQSGSQGAGKSGDSQSASPGTSTSGDVQARDSQSGNQGQDRPATTGSGGQDQHNGSQGRADQGKSGSSSSAGGASQ